MKKILLLLTCFSISWATFGQTTATFDDLPAPGGGLIIPAGYNDFNWDGAVGYYLDGTNYTPNCAGYVTGATSPTNVAFNGFAAYPWTLDYVGAGGTTCINNFNLTAAWQDGIMIRIEGLNGATVTNTMDVTLNTTGPTPVTLDWCGLTALRFALVSPGVDTPCGGSGEHIALDDFTYGALSSAVPTMGEWGLIILALLVLSFGTVFMMRRQTAMAGAGNVSMSQSSGIPFDRSSFGKMLAVVMIGLVVVFAVSVLVFGYEMTNADVPGALIAGPIAAYLLHLLLGAKK